MHQVVLLHILELVHLLVLLQVLMPYNVSDANGLYSFLFSDYH